MRPNIFVCCLCLLLLHVGGAKPVSDLQSLKQLLEEDISTAPFFSSEENTDTEDAHAHTAAFGAPEPQTWNSSRERSSSARIAKENALARLFKDLMRTSKRSWSRYKKGGMRSCFGVRLERIGSFSGLGC